MEIIPGVYQLTISYVNVILIVDDELTLIDTGFAGSSHRIKSFIRRLGRSVEEITLIILTHNHVDHAGGLAELKLITPAKVAAHKADIISAEGELTYPEFTRTLMQTRPISLLRPLQYIKPQEVDLWLEGNEMLKPLGGLRVIHTPGHTPGSISLFSPQRKLLVVGDTINNRYKALRLPPKLVSTNLRQAIDSIKRLAQLDFEILCCGHGRPLTTDARIMVQELITDAEKKTAKGFLL